MSYKRNRLKYGVMIIIVIILGLLSRRFNDFIPSFLAAYLGDILWALMIFIISGFIFKEMKTSKIAIISIMFCYAIELSQLYHASFIDNIRQTTLGGLVLGYVFSFSDLLAYALGIGIGVIVELNYNRIKRRIS